MERHTVYFFEEDDLSWLEPIADFVKNGLGQNETVIVIATEQHRLDLKTKLLADKIIGLEAPSDALYTTLDASTTLPLFMRNGWPDERLFLNVVGQIIGSIQKNTAVRIYQEISAAHLASRDYLVGLHLERLWAKLANNDDRSFLCGYPASAFKGTTNEYFLNEICACHSENIGKQKCSDLAA